jgi:hypothetical protein
MSLAEQAIGKVMDRVITKKTLEWFGVATAIAYSLLIALNLGYEVLGFSLLFVSALAIGMWAVVCKHYGILFLQFFYASAGIIGVVRWF